MKDQASIQSGWGEIGPNVNDDPSSEPVSTTSRQPRSVVREFYARLGEVQFGDRIILFGASLLLSVLPLIILLNALANQRVDDDIAQHLGLNHQGAHVVKALFSPSSVTFNLGVLVSLLLSTAGTVATARSVQVIYERAFDLNPARGLTNLARSFVWVLVTAGLLIAESAFGSTVRSGPGGAVALGVVSFILVTAFFWWSAHFLLGGRESWRTLQPVALATSVFWLGLGVFASLYFSSTIVSDSRLYGEIGVAFTLVTWFIAVGAVITLGAVVGALWSARSSSRRRSAP